MNSKLLMGVVATLIISLSVIGCLAIDDQDNSDAMYFFGSNESPLTSLVDDVDSSYAPSEIYIMEGSTFTLNPGNDGSYTYHAITSYSSYGLTYDSTTNVLTGTLTSSGHLNIAIYAYDISTGTSTSSFLIQVYVCTTFTLIYDTNGGTDAPSTATSTGAISAMFYLSSDIPTKPDYTFMGWSESATEITASYVYPDCVFASSLTTTLYAVWSSSDTTIPHVIVYNYNDGTSDTYDQVVRDGYTSALMTVSDLVPVYPGHTFLGWSQYPDSVVPTFTSGDTISVTIATTLFAIWSVDAVDDTSGESWILDDWLEDFNRSISEFFSDRNLVIIGSLFVCFIIGLLIVSFLHRR